MLSVIVWTVVAIWAPSCVLTLIIFSLDERATRRQTELPTPARVAPKRATAPALSLSKN